MGARSIRPICLPWNSSTLSSHHSGSAARPAGSVASFDAVPVASQA
ncbi:hypothetical protein [Frankia sp. ArI3]|nr:hypothetical protein [Frankia sp. ArI3]